MVAVAMHFLPPLVTVVVTASLLATAATLAILAAMTAAHGLAFVLYVFARKFAVQDCLAQPIVVAASVCH